ERDAPAGLLVPGAARWTTQGVLGVIDAVARDDRAGGLLLAFDDAVFGVAQGQEIRNALVRLRKTGKRAYVHLRGTSNALYLAATGADKIYLDPVTTLNVVGFSSSVLF